MPQLLKEHTTADGCVTFVMQARTTIDVEIVQDQLDRSLPDYSTSTERIQNLAFAYKMCLAHTEDIRFNGVDQESEWHDFKQWWEEGKSHSERDKWVTFRATFERDEINAWWEAFKATRSQRGKAPEGVQPGAEEKAAQDPAFLESDSVISASGGGSSEESQQPKQQRKQKNPDSEPVAHGV